MYKCAEDLASKSEDVFVTVSFVNVLCLHQRSCVHLQKHTEIIILNYNYYHSIRTAYHRYLVVAEKNLEKIQSCKHLEKDLMARAGKLGWCLYQMK